MKKNLLLRKKLTVPFLLTALLFLTLLVACGGAEPETIIQEVEVTRVITETVVETVVEQVEVEGEMVEVEVTRVVEVEAEMEEELPLRLAPRQTI